ncbi:hypothetical protein [Promicromonospora soli]
MRESIDEAVANVELAVSNELADDGVELWSLFRYTRNELPGASSAEILQVVEKALRKLADSGVRFGQIDDETGDFSFWEEDDPVGRIMVEVRALGREPNIGDIAWLVKDVLP